MTTIFHTIDTSGPGGAETVFIELAAGLDATRFRSVASTIRTGWVYDEMLARGLNREITPVSRGGTLPFDPGYFKSLWSLARRSKAALIQSHLPTANLYSGLIGRLLRIPTVGTFHGMVDVATGDRRSSFKMRLITANVSRLVFVSEPLRAHFCAKHQVPIQRTTVIPNGIDPAVFHPAPHDELRRELGFGADAVLIAVVGNVRPAKGYDDLMRVAARLAPLCPNVYFVVLGQQTQPLYSELEVLRRSLGVEDRVRFLGFRADVARTLNGVDAYISTSTSEGFSLTTIQALACGLPVIATRSGGPEQILTDGETGRLVPIRDPGAMASAIEHLLADREFARRLANAGRDMVLRRFTTNQMVASYEAIYDELLGRRA